MKKIPRNPGVIPALKRKAGAHKKKESKEKIEYIKEENVITGIICKVWSKCHHPELCQEECFDEDLIR